MASQDTAIHTAEVNDMHLGLHNSHLWSHFRSTEEKKKEAKRHRGQREKEMYDSEEIMKLCMKHWQYTQERIDSLSLQGLPSSFRIFEMSLNPFCTAQPPPLHQLKDKFPPRGSIEHHKYGIRCYNRLLI